MAFWAAFDGPDRAQQLEHARRLLRPEGRLLVVLDYGRDDLDVVRGEERTASLVAASRRDGWFLSRGFRVRVIHAFWQFETIEEGGELLRAAYGPAAEPAISRLRRPRLAHNVAVYHWSQEGAPAAPPCLGRAEAGHAPGARDAAGPVTAPGARDAARSKRRAPITRRPSDAARPAQDPGA